MGSLDNAAINAAARRHTPAMVEFAQRLIATPSLPGEEGAVATLMANEMRSLGYDDVWIDRAGNAIGVIRGTGGGLSVQFNSHLDHVAPGDPALWPHPPYDPVIEEGILYGRGASDIKGAMATQVYLLPILRDLALRPAGDVYTVGVVLEEVGGFGSEVLAKEMPTDIAVLGESTNNNLNRGHRGRVLCSVSFTGLSAHASAPDRARNPHYAVARFLLEVEALRLPAHPTFGGSTVAPTLVSTDQTSGNVTPATVTIYLDWRSVPGESAESVLAILDPLVQRAAAATDGVSGKVEAVGRPVRTYTGIDAVMPPTRAYELPADDPALLQAQEALTGILGREVTIGTWTFATDGGHLAHHGIRTIGFAPGEEKYAHTIWDQVSIGKMTEALAGNAALAMTLPASRVTS